ncbi:hypothetical protein DH2020_018674 [Rehmannia glutinosa]|uniref:Xaa-Pro dipeptidase n=1 Tax=Rehmannia glutinosa TaxID=99300 RepID=A0ABR0WN60_REHGL
MASPSSLSPPEIPMELHAVNRKKLLDSFREHLSRSSRPLSGFVFLQGGEEQTRHCTDHIELFRQESYFAYLFGVQEPGFYGAIDIASGESLLFAPRLPADYAVWLGEIKSLSYFKERYMVSSTYYTDEITKVLHHQYQGPGKPPLYLLHGLNTDSNNFSKPADFEGIDNFKTDLNTLHPVLTECRVLKSALEISLIQFANDISSEAHVEVMRKAKVGDTISLGLVAISLGHVAVSLSCCPCFVNSALSFTRRSNIQSALRRLFSLLLHLLLLLLQCLASCQLGVLCIESQQNEIMSFGVSETDPNHDQYLSNKPNVNTLEDGDMALLDMGAEYHFYGSDITCSFPVNGKFTRDQSLVYNAVLRAHNAVISSMRPGVSWVNMHKLAERIILESLKEGHLLSGDVDAMVHERLGAVFMPHGLGHLLGIDTHDPGGSGKTQRTWFEVSAHLSRELLEGMVITVEPGCYFIDALLLPAMENTQTSKYFNHDQISRFRGFGGFGLKAMWIAIVFKNQLSSAWSYLELTLLFLDLLSVIDMMYVTCDGCVNMTKCPREIQEIEAVMAGAPWPIKKISIPSSVNGKT